MMRSGALLFAALVALGGCSMGQVEEAQPTDRPTLAFVESEEDPPPTVSAGTMFDFEASELFTGQRVDGGDLVVEGAMIVTFVDPSCPICLREGPVLAEQTAENPDVTFVVVHGFSSVDRYLEYTDVTDLYAENVVHLVDPTGALWNRFGVVTQPATLVVNEAGAVTLTEGAIGEAGYEQILADLDS